MTEVGLIVNPTKDMKLDFTSQIIDWLEKNDCRVLVSRDIAVKMDRNDNGFELEYIYENSNFIITLGGDGTLLGAARQISDYETPILGINMGHLGFLTDVEKDGVFEALKLVLEGEYEIEKRMILEAIVSNDTGIIRTFHCLNEIGITRGTLSRILNLKICINNKYVDTYRADGVLISTPTGSTAYSLSAGGPIISPNVNVLLITPICPHSLSARSMVVDQKEIINIEINKSYQDAYLTADGQEGYELKKEDKITVRKAAYVTKLIKVSNRSFYDVLREKLKERFI